MTEPEDFGATKLARKIRMNSLRMTHHARSSHVGSALSCADILAALYSTVMRHRADLPDWPDRDRFVMGKGHAAVALYACLAECGYFPTRLLNGYGADPTALAGHVTCGVIPGVETSSGSLGHGLPQAAGIALALKLRSVAARAFCLISDGECQEGSTWEGALLSSQWGLANLHVIVDANGQQGLGRTHDIADLEPLADKWRAFGWDVCEVDGHNFAELAPALSRESASPKLTIARTVKGRGVSFMEDQLEWHYRSLNADELSLALKELSSS